MYAGQVLQRTLTPLDGSVKVVIESHHPMQKFHCSHQISPLCLSRQSFAIILHYLGYYYFVAADWLSGWLEVSQIKVGTNEARAQGLCKALRRLMVTFGVPIEISSDGGPELMAAETMAFFRRWGIHHRLSSVSFPSSNGRAELAVKKAKCLLMDSIDVHGKLDNDKMVRALLTLSNTLGPRCKLSPAHTFGSPTKRYIIPVKQRGNDL